MTPAFGVGSNDPPFSPAGVVFQPVSPRLVRVRYLTALTFLVWPLLTFPVVGVITKATEAWAGLAVTVAVTAWLGWLIPRQVRAIGYAERDEDLLVRKGVMFRSLSVIPYGRMQFVDVGMGPYDRLANLATLRLHTASPQSDAKIPGLEPSEAERLRDQLSARGEARLAGL
jgi:membrane protein YdbS with pleckstrin-like domain